MIINKIVNRLPPLISSFIAQYSFLYVSSSGFLKCKKEIEESRYWDDKKFNEYIVFNFNKIFQYSKKFELYRNKYEKAQILNLEIKSLADIRKVPILNKSEIRESLNQFKGAYLQNTGGTTGNPLALYADKEAWNRERAHMNYIWEKVGYNRSIPKFTLRGKNLGDRNIVYKYPQNEYVINTYKNANSFVDEFFDILERKKVKYFHGYPSSVFNFLKEIENNISVRQKSILQTQIKCCFLGSEFPTPQIVRYLKNNWNLDFISWYGHSEICVLASSEMNETNYSPFHTYGYVEEENGMLIGTSYHNFDMPLIRYNTGDLVESVKNEFGMLKTFKIKEGRLGDFIFDKKGKKIPLTALIFGRHHEIFRYINFIQVYQEKKGFATILLSKSEYQKLNPIDLMDFRNVDIEFEFIWLEQPIKTSSGKVSLKVDKLVL